ncbi:hypothetical protein [Micromonospora sp. WMMD975]|uniref:hypothetical protein n=1 Tax=Micromonospora sp. WMMD975 TaxID=3016087 RepID=UPI00249A5BED|nr:hypothetical protein [Micromonospora sp. WMMD975]WFE32603.1 hypothetical protein O7613_24025 [Micromonospora sp. WMMD975]
MAGWLGITQAQLSRVENGPPIVHLDRLAHWARVLRIPAHTLWFQLPSGRDDVRAPVDGEAGLHLIRALRSADRQIGGKNLYGAALTHIAAFSGSARQSPAIPRQMLRAAASLHEMAGWMAHDSGDSATSRRHFRDALALAIDSRDQLLVGQVHGSLGHLACHDGNADAAISHASDGIDAVAKEEPLGGSAPGCSPSGRAASHRRAAPWTVTLLFASRRALSPRRRPLPTPG